MPSSKKAYLAVLEFVNETDSGNIVDFGSGWGNLIIPLAKKFPDRKVTGYELSLLPWLVSSILKRAFGLNNLTINRQNFFTADLTDTSVVICYLFPEAMDKISNKILREGNNIRFLISNNFSFPAKQPSRIIKLNDFYQSNVYLYSLKESD